jgi:F420-0:gamma-glutamyl ligase
MKKKVDQKPVITDLRKLRLQDGDVLVVKETVVSDADRRSFVDTLQNIVNKHVLILFVKQLSDVKTLTDEQMNAAGWYRKDE